MIKLDTHTHTLRRGVIIKVISPRSGNNSPYMVVYCKRSGVTIATDRAKAHTHTHEKGGYHKVISPQSFVLAGVTMATDTGTHTARDQAPNT